MFKTRGQFAPSLLRVTLGHREQRLSVQMLLFAVCAPRELQIAIGIQCKMSLGSEVEKPSRVSSARC